MSYDHPEPTRLDPRERTRVLAWLHRYGGRAHRRRRAAGAADQAVPRP